MKRSAPRDETTPSPPPAKKKVESNATGKAVANFFKKASEKEPELLKWRILHDSLLVGRYEPSITASTSGEQESPSKRRKIAAFDFDSTLVETSSGNVFGKSAEDWRWWKPVVAKKLQELNGAGYQVVIISNQKGISLKHDPKKPQVNAKTRLLQFKTKVGYVLSQLDIPITIYAATEDDGFRKPRTGMWSQLMVDYELQNGSDDAVDLESSFFVGDAGGRQAGPGNLKADHSCSDRNFASNVGIPFHTPEEYFLDERPRPFVRAFDPITIIQDKSTGRSEEEVPEIVKKYPLDLILLCGSPGAGKSTFYATHLQPLGYSRVNQDILKTRDKCIKVASDYLSAGQSVAVDNTNADPDVRSHWISLARKHSIPIRAIYLTTPAAICRHNDAVRAAYSSKVTTSASSGSSVVGKNRNENSTETAEEKAEDLSILFNPEHRTALPRMAFDMFWSRHAKPCVEEGFDDVLEIPFVFRGSASAKAVWGRHWI